jgi:hypothetical protein
MKQRSKHFASKDNPNWSIHPVNYNNSFLGQTKTEQIDKLDEFRIIQFNGSILSLMLEKLFVKKGFEMANMEWNIPNRQTLNTACSVIKTVYRRANTSISGEGKLKLDALLQPIFLIILNMKSKITIHHLPTHTS